MAIATPPDVPVHFFEGEGGARLAYRTMGEGVPLLLIHGLFSNAWTNWIRYGHAARLVAAGFRVVMPDLRGHGDSARPHDPAAYPPDVLAADAHALVRHLALDQYHLAGYSLGGRTCVRMLVQGARPAAVVLSGMGLEGLLDTQGRVGFFRDVLENVGHHPRGSATWMAEAFLKTTGGDPSALLPLLDSFVDTDRAELAAIDRPVLVLTGVDDHDNGSAEALAAAIPDARHETIPGTHMSAVLRPELGEAMARFLGDRLATP